MKTKDIGILTGFEAVFSDGDRKQANEGILIKFEEAGVVLLANSSRPAPMFAAVEAMLTLFAQQGLPMCAIAASMAVEEESRKVLAQFAQAANAALAVDPEELWRSFDFRQVEEFE